MNATLYYIADPMCSWCWGFHPVLQKVRGALPADIALVYVMGGLAKDSDEPMPDEIRAYVQNAWREVSEKTGARFNWDFWTRCSPVRSTYPACRGVLSAAAQEEEAGPTYFEAVQKAYYLQARNPSETETLVELAGEIGLDESRFAAELRSPKTEQRLQDQFSTRRRLGIRQFPSLVLETCNEITVITKGYSDFDPVMAELAPALSRLREFTPHN